MIRVETDELALMHASGKLLTCHGIVRGTTPKTTFSSYPLGLQSDDLSTRSDTIGKLHALVGNG